MNGHPCDIDEDYEAVFESVSDMASFNFKGPLPKLARWFAWWGNFAFHFRELWGLNAVIQYYHDGELGESDFNVYLILPAGSDPAKELRQLKQTAGGFKLAFEIITQAVLVDIAYATCARDLQRVSMKARMLFSARF
jgi:hypothetical protein